MHSNLLQRRPDLMPSVGIAVGAMLWGLFWVPVRAIEQAGVGAIYGPGTNIPAAAREVLRLIERGRLAA